MRWTQRRCADEALRMRTAKSCGPDTRRWCQVRAKERGRRGNKARSPGEHEISCKTIACGMLVFSGELVVTTAGAAVYPFLPARLRVHWAPGIPTPSFGAETNAKLDASRRGNAESYLRYANAQHTRRRHPECALLRASKDEPQAPLSHPSFEARRRGSHLRMTETV